MSYDVFQSCLFVPGPTHTECASWVQAWGSIAAIAAAVWVSHRAIRTSEQLARDQAAHTRQAYVRARVERHMEQIGPVLELFDAAATELDYQYMLVMNSNRTGMFRSEPPRLDELKWIQRAFDEVPVHHMPTSAATGCLLNGRVFVKDAAVLIENLLGKSLVGLSPSEDDDRLYREALRLIQQERERLRLALVRLIEAPGTSLVDPPTDLRPDAKN